MAYPPTPQAQLVKMSDSYDYTPTWFRAHHGAPDMKMTYEDVEAAEQSYKKMKVPALTSLCKLRGIKHSELSTKQKIDALVLQDVNAYLCQWPGYRKVFGSR